jgi:hypothetical protein
MEYEANACKKGFRCTLVGRIVPEEELPSDFHLSQLSQEFLEEEDPNQGFLESTQAYMLLYPTFKQIICLATGDRKLAAVSYNALKSLHKTLLQKLVPSNEAINKERNTQPNGFQSSNLELDGYAKWNKQIQPRGEYSNQKKKKN